MREDRKIVIAGAGVAALEALLALRALGVPHLDIVVLAPGDSFLYRPVSVAEAFGAGEAREFELAGILDDQAARRRADSLASVDAGRRTVRTSTGVELEYDELVIALGARQEAAVPGALTFGGRRDVPALRAVLRELDAGAISRVAFVLPTGAAWPLPLYELALLTQSFIAQREIDGRALIVSSEESPLALFGDHASEAVRELLDERGVELHTLSLVKHVADGALTLAGGGTVRADRAIALPRLRGPAIPGLPHDREGFIPIDVHGRVRGLEGVYAAGDATAFPLKQGGLAAQQADAIAELIAARAGAAITPKPFAPVIRGLLLTGGVPLYLRAGPGALRREPTVANERGDAAPRRRRPESSASASALWWPPSKIAGRYLAPYLATARPDPLGSRPLYDRPRRERAADRHADEAEHEDALGLALILAENDARWGDYAMALEALDSAEALAGALPPWYATKRREWQQALISEGHSVRVG